MARFMFGKNGSGGFKKEYGTAAWCQAMAGIFARNNNCGLERIHALLKEAQNHKLCTVWFKLNQKNNVWCTHFHFVDSFQGL